MRSGTDAATPGDDHAAVAVADEHDVVQLFPLDEPDEVVDMRVKAHAL